MFTGIIEELGKIRQIQSGKDSARIFIEAKTVMEGTKLGDSICVNGVCLTVTEIFAYGFSADIMSESLKRSSLGDLKTNSLVNLERAMQMGGRFGGHIVSGHIDGIGNIKKMQRSDIAIFFTIESDAKILKYIIEKGSIAVDGISLTVVSVTDKDFTFSIIPHTLENTVLKTKTISDTVNLEVDLVGKYVEKLLSIEPAILENYKALTKQNNNNGSKITNQFLAENGFL